MSVRKGTKVTAALLAVAVLQFVPVRAVLAADHYVPAEYATIQDAIDMSGNGDRVIVAPGNYGSYLSVPGRFITIMSETGNTDCSIAGVSVHPDGSLRLSGFTLPEAYLDTRYEDGGGSSGLFVKCKFTGDGIYAVFSYPKVDGCTFVNRASIYLAESGQVPVSNSSFSGTGNVIDARYSRVTVTNTTFRGGCRVYLEAQGGIDVSDCTFEDGSGVKMRGGDYLYVGYSRFTGPGSSAIEATTSSEIDHCVISGFTNGIVCGDGVLSNSVLVGNHFGASINGGYWEISNSTIAGNDVGVKLSASTELNMLSTIVAGNNWLDVSASGPDQEFWTQNCLVNSWYGFLWWVQPQSLITADPRFVRTPSPGPDWIYATADDDLGDLRLAPMSPCIDKGIGKPLGTDVAGNPRTYGLRVDIGAYELQGGPLSAAGLLPEAYLVGKTGGLAVYGTGLLKGCTVFINGVAHTTSFISEFHVSVRITTADTAVAGIYELWVVNPGGEISNTVPFVVANPKPAILSLSPNARIHGGPDFELVLLGARFVPGAVVLWKGSPRPTTFNSAGQLTALISAADIAVVGSLTVTVVNPGPGGGVSNVKTFRIH
jgi:hypothetical protein